MVGQKARAFLCSIAQVRDIKQTTFTSTLPENYINNNKKYPFIFIVFLQLFFMPFLLKYYANLPHKHQFVAVGDFGTLWGSFWITAIHFRSTTDILQLFSPAVQKPRVLKVSHSLFKSWQCHEHLQSPERENVSPVCDYVRTRIQARQADLFIGNLRKEAEHQAGARSDLPFCFP